MKKLFLSILLLWMTFGLFACGEVVVDSIAVKEDTVPAYVSLNNVKNNLNDVLDDIKIVITKSDDSVEEVVLTDSMISADDKAKLLTVGAHEITVKYDAFETKVTIEVKDPYSVKVLMPDGTPAPTTVKIQWCTDKNCLPTKNINEEGICENPISDNKYYIHLEHVPAGYTYNPNAYVATPESKHVEIVLTKLSEFASGDGSYENPFVSSLGIYEVSYDAQGTEDLQFFAFTPEEDGKYTIESLAVDKNAINRIDPYLGFLGEVNDTTNLDPSGNIENVANFKYSFNAEANKTYYFAIMCSSADDYPADYTIMISK